MLFHAVSQSRLSSLLPTLARRQCHGAVLRNSSGVAAVVEHTFDCSLVDPPQSPAFGVAVYPSFLTPDEEAALVALAESALSGRRWEEGHWDGVIRGYREAQRAIASFAGNALAAGAVARALRAFPRDAGPPEPAIHALELRADGAIDAHVDSVKFSGGVVAGLCLLSSAVMHLTPAVADAGGGACGEGERAGGVRAGDGGALDAPARVSVLLPQRALYVLSGPARYHWAHAIPAGTPEFRGAPVLRQRRISIMLRDRVPGG